MNLERLAKVLQFTAAALAVPVAAGGAYSVYRTHFSSDVACQNLRAAIITTMEKNVPIEAKRSLLRKDVVEFEKQCGEIDPDARELFAAAIAEPTRSQAAALAAPSTRSPAMVTGSIFAAAAAPRPEFGSAATAERIGWVALGRPHATQYSDMNFDGYAISSSALSPAGTLLKARWAVPVWRQPPLDTAASEVLTPVARVRAGACVRIVSVHVGARRMWGEVTAATCS
jgi:hypothetical protein